MTALMMPSWSKADSWAQPWDADFDVDVEFAASIDSAADGGLIADSECEADVQADAPVGPYTFPAVSHIGMTGAGENDRELDSPNWSSKYSDALRARGFQRVNAPRHRRPAS